MTRLVLITSLAVALGACASRAVPPPHAATLGGPASRVVELPAAPSAGEPREARVLVDEPALRLASIVLRGGTVLPTHHAEVPVTIMAIHGSGTVVVGSERLPIDPTHAVVLAPKVPHSVEPAPGTDLVLLVHHLGHGDEHHR
jgi:mannose-6-phosphate isomerase-like protein (cupin superfamily)